MNIKLILFKITGLLLILINLNSCGFYRPVIAKDNPPEPEKRIHRDIIIAMAVLETGYGKSRFATEANNLFGIRTWSKNVPQMKALANPDAVWGVKKYKTKCLSVKDMIGIINRLPVYQAFRDLRAQQQESGKHDIDALIDQLHKWSTNPEYTKLVKSRAKHIAKILENRENSDE